MLIGGSGGQCAYGVNDDLASATAPGLAQERHDMRCGTGRIAAPDEDELALKQHLRRRREPGAHRQQNGFFRRVATDGAYKPRRSQPVPEARIANGPVDQPQRACIAVRQDTLRPILRDDVAPAARDLRNRLIPAYALERAIPFRANAPHRIEQAVGMVDAIKVAIDFGAQPAARHRMVSATTHADGPPLLIHPRLQSATIGAIMGARAIDNAQVTLFFHQRLCGKTRQHSKSFPINSGNNSFIPPGFQNMRNKASEEYASYSLCNILTRTSRANTPGSCGLYASSACHHKRYTLLHN